MKYGSMLLVALCAAPLLRAEERYDLGDGLTFTPVGLAEVVHRPRSAQQLKGEWQAKAGEVELVARFFVLDGERFGFVEPEDVNALVAMNRDRGGAGRPPFRFDSVQALAGERFGYVPYAALGRASFKEGTRTAGTFFCLAGLTPTDGWALELECRPVPEGDDLALIERFLAECISAASDQPRVWEWTDEQARERWRRDVTEDLTDELDKIVRTEHYIVLTNSGGGKKFGQNMEECYEEIQAVFPFPEVAERKLMPVFLFRTREQYAHFMSKVTGNSVEESRRSAGHAFRDYYATTYEAPGDPVHIHEATHQIFGNRLGLSGGGSWFQEGVAEYISTDARTRKNWAKKAAKKETFKPFEQFFVVPSMLYSADEKNVKGGSEARDNYTQAASVIEFARDGKWQPERFQDFIHAVGSCPRGDLAVIEAALYSVYEVGIDDFQAEWVEYWQKR